MVDITPDVKIISARDRVITDYSQGSIDTSVSGSSLLPANQSVTTPEDIQSFGDKVGALKVNATTLRMGSGSDVFQIDSSRGIHLGAADFANAKFSVNLAGDLIATSATISGSITATTGAIGGFNIGADYIRDVANSFGLASTVTGGNDVRIFVGDTFANRATAPLRIYENGDIVGTQATFTGTLNATGGYIGTTTALVYESQGINCGVTGHIRGGQTAYHTGTGFFLGYESGAYKFSVGDPTGRYITWDGANLNVNGYAVTGIGSFGGNGSDGALTLTSGTTTVNLGAAAVVVLNYSSVSITGTGKLAFSNPHANGTIIIIKCAGGFTVTSSNTPCIDASGMGATGGTGGVNTANGAIGTNGQYYYDVANHYGLAGAVGTNGGSSTAGAASTALTQSALVYYSTNNGNRLNLDKSYRIACGSGGGGGGSASDAASQSGTGGDGGDGGRGGGGLIIECAGAWNFTTSGGISVSGAVGSAGQNGVRANTLRRGAGGGGGGGASGMLLALWNSLTANSGTVVSSGGAGGVGGNKDNSGSTNSNEGGGAAGSGAAAFNAGGAGGNGKISTGDNGSSGGAGAGGGGGGGAGANSDANPYSGGTGGTSSSDSDLVLITQNKFFS